MITKDRFSSFWFWWIMLTFIYILLSSFGGLDMGGLIGHITGFFGLFVPFGFLSLLIELGDMRLSWHLGRLIK